MAKRNRDTLRNFFRKGALPSEAQFGDLIDSTLNLIDEGFVRTPANGIEVTTHGERDRLLTFFRGSQPGDPKWTVGFRGDGDRLHFSAGSGDETAPAAFTVAPQGHVGVNRDDPAWALDVKGVVRAEGRVGANPTNETTVPADGEWHDVTGPLTGCQAFEVMAGVGKKKTGRYALMHAFALNTFQPAGLFFNFLGRKNRIGYHQAYYLSRRDKLRLRWLGDKDKYFLQLRSNSDYGDGIRIRYFMTRLWFDDDMSESWQDL